MRIVYDHTDIIERLNTQSSQLVQVLQQLQTLIQKESDMANNLETIQGKLNELKADVAAEKTVQQSAITLLNGLVAQNTAFAQQIKDLIAAGGTPEQLATLVADFDATNAQIKADTTELSDAVKANTPSA